ncbi:MAG: hypothetical protein WC438_04975 [Candidatus Pacearchaeota archaeon]
MVNKITISLMISLILIISISLVSAEFWACFDKGDKIDYCNPAIKDPTCSSSGGCERCMSVYNNTKNCYNQGNWNVCNTIGDICDKFGNGTIDQSPPEFTLKSPINKKVYDSRAILVEFSLDEKSSVYYIDNIYGKKGVRLCNNCYDYSRKVSFKEGFNNITFKAMDVLGNYVDIERTFIIDSKVPRIHKTEPRSGYASGDFYVQYSEDNVKGITIYYGNLETGFKQKELKNCSSGNKQWCFVSVDLKSYNNQKIEYYFIVKDVANNEKKSQIKKLNVDVVYPVLNNPKSFWKQGTGKDSKYIYFSLNITEDNLDKVSYTYEYRGMEKEKTLCSGSQQILCTKKVMFTPGNYSLNVQIIDEAGNAISYPVKFNVK